MFGARILELKERSGFGFAMREGLAHISTPYVIVVQHDRNFKDHVDVVQLMRVITTNSDWVNFIGLMTGTTVRHKHHVLSKVQSEAEAVLALLLRHIGAHVCHTRVLLRALRSLRKSQYGKKIKDVEIPEEGVSLLPLVQWYDSTHVASTRYYRDFVFNARAKRVKRGGFIEDKLGQEQLRLFLQGGMEAHKPYGTYLLRTEVPVVSHLDGHDRLNAKKVRMDGG